MQVSRIILRGAALLGLTVAVTLGAMVAAPSFAGAQTDGYDGYDGYDGDDDGYDGYDGEDDADTGGEAAAPPPASGSDTLPLTGAPTLLAGAIVVAGVGIAIRRFSTV